MQYMDRAADRIILASGSPRRRELLSKAGLEFVIEVSHEEEHYTKTFPGDIVTELAAQKAGAVANKHPEDCLVIGADTVVSVDGVILGKPKDTEDAVRMIRSFQGRSHQVYTGVCLIRHAGGTRTEKHFHECTDVHVLPMTDDEIRDYVATGECMDAAGSYKIQGRFGKWIDRIEGDRDNVIGFPTARFLEEAKEF